MKEMKRLSSTAIDMAMRPRRATGSFRSVLVNTSPRQSSVLSGAAEVEARERNIRQLLSERAFRYLLRGVDQVVARLLSTHAPSPIARGFTGQFAKSGSESGLGGIAERRCDRHDGCIGIAQHVHGLFKPVLT